LEGIEVGKTVAEHPISGYAYVALNQDDFNYLAMNKRYFELIGFEQKEPIGKEATYLHTDLGSKRFIESIAKNESAEKEKSFVWIRENPTRYFQVFVNYEANQRATIKINEVTQQIEKFLVSEELFNLTPILFCVTDFQGTILMLNDEWTITLGYKRTEMVGKSLLSFVYKKDLQKTIDSVNKMGEDRVVYNFVNRYRHKDGSYRFFEWRAQINDNLVFAAARDITSRLESEREKQEELDLLNLLFNQTLTGMIILQLDEPVSWPIDFNGSAYDNLVENLKVVRINDALANQYRMDVNSIIGRSAKEFIEFGITDPNVDFTYFLNRGKVTVEYEGRRFDGSSMWVRGDYTTLFNAKGEFYGMFGMQIDITDRKNGELALEKKERMFRLITENASDVIWVFDVEKDIFTYISPSVYRFLGYKSEALIGKNFTTTIHPQDKEEVVEQIDAMIKSFIENKGDINFPPIRVRHIDASNKIVWCEVTISFRYKEDDKIEAIGVGRDITKRKKDEEKILHLSYRDQLTNLYNRRYFEEYQDTLLFDNSLLPISIIISDLNGLKLTNDVFGHYEGDRLLKNAAAVLTEEVDSSATVLRLGGDEFLMILAHCDQHTALKKIEAMQKNGRKTYVGEIPLSLSFGTSTAYEPIKDLHKILRDAEQDMYRHKLKESNIFKESVVSLLINNLYAKGKNLKRHSILVSSISEKLGKQLNLGKTIIEELKLAGMLHDIGKIGMDSQFFGDLVILNKDDKSQIMRHPEIGFNILRSVPKLNRIAEWILMHHERPDGRGFPQRLSNDQIPLEAKIIGVANDCANLIDKLDSDYEKIFAELVKGRGSKYDTLVLDTLLSLPLEKTAKELEKEALKIEDPF
jgi:diguanylate cyclase (GGDEF)-like protein/PAS domain S-box-containing protein/putative nucleotidyltransferase with HDIG domain